MTEAKPDEEFVALQEVWDQASGDYDACKRMRALQLRPSTTVAEIMAWAHYRGLASGDVRLVRAAPQGEP